MKLFFSISFFCVSILLFSQNKIQGKVVDENNNPMVGVSLFLDGTTIGFLTDETGNFYFEKSVLPQSVLVVGYLGYETQRIQNYSSSFLSIKLSPSITQLREVIVSKPFFTRKQMMSAFKDHFLGKTKAGRSCFIENESAIQLDYDGSKNQLNAHSDSKLVIINKHLGYKLVFELQDFNVKFSKKSISNQYVKSSFFAGTSFFSDLTNNKTEITNKNRIKSYLGSYNHLFKNLVDKKWDKKSFLLFEGSFVTDPNLQFKVDKIANLYMITVLNNKLKAIQNAKIGFFNSFNILYNNREQSKINFKINEFQVDEFGNFFPVDKIEFSGDISEKRVGDMLPIDFIPN